MLPLWSGCCLVHESPEFDVFVPEDELTAIGTISGPVSWNRKVNVNIGFYLLTSLKPKWKKSGIADHWHVGVFLATGL